MKMIDELYAAIDQALHAPGEFVSMMEAQSLDARFASIMNAARLLKGEDFTVALEYPEAAPIGDGMGSMMSRPAYKRGDLSVIRANVDRVASALREPAL